jgi:hypothetical protein
VLRPRLGAHARIRRSCSPRIWPDRVSRRVHARLARGVPSVVLAPGCLAHAAYLASAVGTYEYLTYCDAFMWCGLAVAILACVLRMRGRPVRQFGLAVVSLVVSCLGVYQWGHMKWMIWRLGY